MFNKQKPKRNDLAPKEKVPDSTRDLHAFVELCGRPDYINRPYAPQWPGIMERDSHR